MRIAGRQELENERLPWLDLNGDLFARGQAVKKHGRWQDADIRVSVAEFVVLHEYIRIEKITQEIVRANGVTYLPLELGGRFGEVDGFQACAWTAFERSGSAKDYLL